MRRITIIILQATGAMMLAGAIMALQTPPDTAMSNAGLWVKKISGSAPLWMQPQSFDTWATVILSMIAGAVAWSFWQNYLRWRRVGEERVKAAIAPSRVVALPHHSQGEMATPTSDTSKQSAVAEPKILLEKVAQADRLRDVQELLTTKSEPYELKLLEIERSLIDEPILLDSINIKLTEFSKTYNEWQRLCSKTFDKHSTRLGDLSIEREFDHIVTNNLYLCAVLDVAIDVEQIGEKNVTPAVMRLILRSAQDHWSQYKSRKRHLIEALEARREALLS